VTAVGGRLAAILRSGAFAVTGEIVPPRSTDGAVISEHARGQVGYVDAINVTDNPTGSAHMSAAVGASFVARAGIEPTLQITLRDRNRLAITSELLGAWAVGARNVLCLTGDPLHLGDHPDAGVVNDIGLLELIALVKTLRDEGRTMGGSEIVDPPRYLVGAADMPLANPYDPARLEVKLDAGADVIWTQITYDVDALANWVETIRAHGFLERARFIVGVVPLRSAKAARFMDDKLPGVRVPPAFIEALDGAGDDAEAVGLDLTVDVVKAIGSLDGISGVHLMGMGRVDLVRAVVDRAGLFPRPTGSL
jgi:methylenetetrahydrofolate reductase (NADPH)